MKLFRIVLGQIEVSTEYSASKLITVEEEVLPLLRSGSQCGCAQMLLAAASQPRTHAPACQLPQQRDHGLHKPCTASEVSSQGS